MKARLMTVYFVAVISFAVSAFAQTRLDVTIEGPWILYVDSDFAKPTKVLVVFTPGSDVTGRYDHNPPFFTTGNGVPLKPGTYCVGFDTKCAIQRVDASHSPIVQLLNDGYPTTAKPLLPVSSPPGWTWFNHRTNGTYLVFPMPDSLSYDGVFTMSFGAQFKGHDYPNYQQPIGVQLHYDGPSGGAAKLELYNCGTSSSATDCTTLENEQINYGTLEVGMKAPRNENACDWHVRSAYQRMLSLLDPKLTQNKNIAFIDIPYKVDDQGPQYDNECYDCDEQNPKYGSTCPLEKAEYGSTLNASARAAHDSMLDIKTLDVKEQLDAILAGLEKDPKKEHNKTLMSQLCDIKTALSGGKHGSMDFLPTFSQLDTLQFLLPETAARLSRDAEDLEAAPDSVAATSDTSNCGEAKSALATSTNFKTVVEELEATAVKARHLAAYSSSLDATKDGKDCRAPMVMLHQQ